MPIRMEELRKPSVDMLGTQLRRMKELGEERSMQMHAVSTKFLVCFSQTEFTPEEGVCVCAAGLALPASVCAARRHLAGCFQRPATA